MKRFTIGLVVGLMVVLATQWASAATPTMVAGTTLMVGDVLGGHGYYYGEHHGHHGYHRGCQPPVYVPVPAPPPVVRPYYYGYGVHGSYYYGGPYVSFGIRF